MGVVKNLNLMQCMRFGFTHLVCFWIGQGNYCWVVRSSIYVGVLNLATVVL